jgi:hypothetical protein
LRDDTPDAEEHAAGWGILEFGCNELKSAVLLDFRFQNQKMRQFAAEAVCIEHQNYVRSLFANHRPNALQAWPLENRTADSLVSNLLDDRQTMRGCVLPTGAELRRQAILLDLIFRRDAPVDDGLQHRRDFTALRCLTFLVVSPCAGLSNQPFQPVEQSIAVVLKLKPDARRLPLFT